MSEEHLRDAFLIVRLDGRDFHILAEQIGVKRPFDPAFALSFVEACKPLFEKSPGPLLAYLVSDEANLVFSGKKHPRRLTRTVPLMGEVFQDAFRCALGTPLGKMTLVFDLYVFWTGKSGVLHYLAKRQDWAYFNFLRAYAYWTKVTSGLTSIQAKRSLKDLNSTDLRKIICENGTNPDDSPLWQHRGILVRRKERSILSGEEHSCISALDVDLETTLFKTREGERYLCEILGSGNAVA